MAFTIIDFVGNLVKGRAVAASANGFRKSLMNGIPGKLSIVRHMALPVFPLFSPHGDFLQPVDGLAGYPLKPGH
jgi:cobalamin biosynthesis protein CbiD